MREISYKCNACGSDCNTDKEKSNELCDHCNMNLPCDTVSNYINNIEKPKEKIVLLSIEANSWDAALSGERRFVVLTRLTNDELEKAMWNDRKIRAYAELGNIKKVMRLLKKKGLVRTIDCEWYDVDLHFLPLNFEPRE